MGGNEKGKQIQWHDREIGKERVQVSNPSVPIGEIGLESHHPPSFLSPDLMRLLVRDLDESCGWQWEGFEQKRRVQRFSLRDDQLELLPSSLRQLVQNFQEETNRIPTHMVCEEYPHAAMIHPSSQHVVTTFETTNPCSCCTLVVSDDSSLNACRFCNTCFVAHLSIGQIAALQHLNKPKLAEAECWQLSSPNHWTDIKLSPGCMLIKTGECLWRWRSRTCRGSTTNNGSGFAEGERCIVVKLHNLKNLLPEEDEGRGEGQVDLMAAPNMEPSMTMRNNNDEVMPPIEDLLTIIVTTSPVRSNPETELLEFVFETFLKAGRDFAVKCRKLIVCDGCRVLEEGESIPNGSTSAAKVSRKHSTTKHALRSGIATSVQAENYTEFKRRLRKLCKEAREDESPFYNAVVEELDVRHGYGFALGHALKNCNIETPYVCVVQHDRTFMRTTPLRETLEAMWRDPQRIKYVGMSMRSNLRYRDIFRTKYGYRSDEEFGQLVVRPRVLELDASKYGPNSESVQSLDVRNASVLTKVKAFADAYSTSAQQTEQQRWVLDHPPSSPTKHQLTLTPTFFWYDNTHICNTAFYRDFIFDPQYKMVVRGGFVEEKVSPAIVNSAERLGLAAGHARFGCYLLDDHSGYYFTGHLDGGSYLTQEQRDREHVKWKQR